MKFEIGKDTVNKVADYTMVVAGIGAAKTMVDAWKKLGGFNTPWGVVGGAAVAIASGITGAAGVDYVRDFTIKLMDQLEKKEETKNEETEVKDSEEVETETA